MRISDWSSDVCSSDLGPTAFPRRGEGGHAPGGCAAAAATGRAAARPGPAPAVCAAHVGPAPAHRGAQVSRPSTIVAFKLKRPTSKSANTGPRPGDATIAIALCRGKESTYRQQPGWDVLVP